MVAEMQYKCGVVGLCVCLKFVTRSFLERNTKKCDSHVEEAKKGNGGVPE